MGTSTHLAGRRGNSGGCRCTHRLAMDTTTVITNLTIDWICTERTREGRTLLQALDETTPGIAALGLATALAEAGPLPVLERMAVLSALLVRSSDDHLARRALVQALLPGLLGVGRALSWGAGGPWTSGGELLLDAISTSYEVIAAWGGQTRPYAGPDILSAVRCRLRRIGETHRAALATHLTSDHEPADPSGARSSAEDVVRAAASLQNAKERTAVVGRAGMDLTWSELAALLGTSRRGAVAAAEAGARAILEAADLASPPRRSAPGAPTR